MAHDVRLAVGIITVMLGNELKMRFIDPLKNTEDQFAVGYLQS